MTYRWPEDRGLALSLVVNVEEGAEQNIDDGDHGPDPVDELQAVPRKPIRAHAAASNYQYGLNEGAPRVLALLDSYGVAATWTAAGLALVRRPDLAKAIMARGDEVCSHGYRWVPQFEMNEETEREFIRQAADAIEQATGRRPVGWLSRYLYTDRTRRLLLEEGYRYHMDDFSADAPFWDRVEMADGMVRPLAILPYALDTNDMKFWLDPSYTPADWLHYAKDTLDCLLAESATRPRLMSLGMHLRIIGRPGRIGALQSFLEYATSKAGIWIATREKIGRAFHPCGSTRVMSSGALSFSRDGAIGRLTIDRPDKRNALTSSMLETWPWLLGAAADDDRVRVLLITGGAGLSFCSGADIEEFQSLRDDREARARFSEHFARAQEAMAAFPKPAIAMISESCIGGGCGLALGCDLRFADTTARFGITPAKLGLDYGLADTRRLVDAVGYGVAADLLFSSRFIDSQEALDLGLINRRFEPADLEQATLEFARRIAGNAPSSLRAIKAHLKAIKAGQTDDEANNRQAFLDAFDSDDFAEGLAAFQARRRPNFQ